MADTLLDTWADAIDAFPLTGTADARLGALVRYAIRAPSSHNTQPWRFRVAGGALEVRADRSRALLVVDPHHRALIISCGAAVEYAVVAARHFGCDARVESLPDPADPDLLARIRLAGPCTPVPADHAMFAAIPRRRTTRTAFLRRAPSTDRLDHLAAAAAPLGATVSMVTDPGEKAAIAALVMEGDRIQMADPAFRSELAGWMRPNSGGVVDGMPGAVLGMNGVTALVAPLVIRTFDIGPGIGARDRDLAELSPVLAVLSTPSDTAADWLAAGRALARLLLLAHDVSLQASFLNQPIEVPSLRDRLAALVRSGVPQLLLRMGYASAGPASPRRTLEEVLD